MKSRQFEAESDELRRLNGNLAAQLARRERTHAAGRRIGHVFQTIADPAERWATLIATIADLVGARRCLVLIRQPGTRNLVGRVPGRGWSADQIAAIRVPLDGPSPLARAWLAGQPVYQNEATEGDAAGRCPGATGERNRLLVPLWLAGRVVALLHLNDRTGDFSAADGELLRTIGLPIALALETLSDAAVGPPDPARFEALFQNISDGVMILDEQHRISAWNPALEQLTGWLAADALGTGLEPGSGPGTETIVRAIVEAGPSSTFETRIVTRLGHQRDVRVRYLALPTPGRPGTVESLAIFRDQSPIQEAERLKNQFLGLVSQELRTPLAALRASIGVLGDHLPADFPPLMDRLVGNIDRSSRRLETLIGDLLDQARLANRRFAMHPAVVDARQIVAAVTTQGRSLTEAEQQPILIEEPADPVPIAVDRVRIEQVLTKLLANALHHGPPGQPIAVGLVDEGLAVQFWVRDQGPGIDPAHQRLVFDRFEQVPSGNGRPSTGSGLGLALAKALVEEHGGQIGFDSRPGAGSTFWFRLPKERPHENSADR